MITLMIMLIAKNTKDMLYRALGSALSLCKLYIKDLETPRSSSIHTTEFTVNRYTYCPLSSGPKNLARYQFATKEASIVMAWELVVKAMFLLRFISLTLQYPIDPYTTTKGKHYQDHADDLPMAEIL